MTAYIHTSTFLRSALLDDPFSLGDLMGPEDVLRIEREYPELFSPIELPTTPMTPSPKTQQKLAPAKKPFNLQVGTTPSVTSKKVQIQTNIRPQLFSKTTAAIGARLPSKSYQQRQKPVIGKSRSTPTKPAAEEASRRLLKKAIGAKSQGNLSSKKFGSPKVHVPPEPERHEVDRKSMNVVPTLIRKKTSSHAFAKPSPSIVTFQVEDSSTVTLDITENKCATPKSEYQADRDPPVSNEYRFQVSVPSSSSSACSSPLEKYSDFLSVIKSDKGPNDREHKQTLLEEETVDRCEQLLLARCLASKYEREGKFQKKEPRRKKRVTITEPPIHEYLLNSYERQNRNFKQLLTQEPSLLKKIAKELIYAEVANILIEEKTKAANKRVILTTPKLENAKDTKTLTKSEVIPSTSEPGKNTKTTSNNTHCKETTTVPKITADIGVLTERELFQTEVATSVSEERTKVTTKSTKNVGVITEREHINTFIRTPLSERSVIKCIVNSIKESVVEQSPPPPVPSPTPRKSLSHKLEDVRKLLSQHEQDLTDCSELEDFVASESGTGGGGPRRNINISPPEQCITEVSTPELNPLTPQSFCMSEAGHDSAENKASSHGHTPARSKQSLGAIIKTFKSVELQTSPQEDTDKFDLSDLETSLTSLRDWLEIISEGELLREEEKSPGELSYNFSPGVHLPNLH